MQQFLIKPLSLLICLSVLSGWFVHDFQAYNFLKIVTTQITESTQKADQAELEALTESTTPNINTNWFTEFIKN